MRVRTQLAASCLEENVVLHCEAIPGIVDLDLNWAPEMWTTASFHAAAGRQPGTSHSPTPIGKIGY